MAVGALDDWFQLHTAGFTQGPLALQDIYMRTETSRVVG